MAIEKYQMRMNGEKDGTHVQSYKVTTPDHTQRNNYSAQGNGSPHTGKTGRKPAHK